MSDASEGRTWKDRDQAEWELGHREATGERPPRTVFRGVTHTFVAILPAGVSGLPDAETLQAMVDGHLGRTEGDVRTARLWSDPRSGIEWEVEPQGGELVFWSGTEAVRTPWGDGRKSPREMSDQELVDALDRAERAG